MAKANPSTKKLFSGNRFAWLLVFLGSIGFLASLILSYEKYQLAVNPARDLICSINPIIACEGSLNHWSDSLLLSVPNSYFGIAAFSALAAVGVMLLAGAKPKEWFWKLFYSVTLGGVAMVGFFLYQSLYQIGSLCIYCMTTWAVVLALFVYSSFYFEEKKLFRVPAKLKSVWQNLKKNHFGTLLLFYLFIFALVLFRFRDYFESVWF